jgi:hypothetical protein
VLLEAFRVANPSKACAGKISYRDLCLESFISKDDEAAVTSVPELLPPDQEQFFCLFKTT